MALQHVVLFSFPRQPSDAEYDDMRSQIAAWPEKIGGFSRLRFGADITGARTRGYSRLLFMEFADADALQRYRDHPVHQDFNQWVIDHECTPLAFDFFLDESTVLMPEQGATDA